MIHHVQLACPPGSEAASREFYSGVLGLAEIPKPPALAARGGCWFRGSGIELHLGIAALAGIVILAWAGRLRASGAPVTFDDDFPGRRRFYTQDPHGNRLEFLEPTS